MPVNERPLEIEIEVRNPTNRRTGGRRPEAEKPAGTEPPRITRLARLLSLAIKFDVMVERGEVRDYADLARLGYVTRARLTQIMNLLLLASDLQELILFSPANIDERRARSIVSLVEWREQRKCFTLALGK